MVIMGMERLQLANLVAMDTRKSKVLQLEAMMTTPATITDSPASTWMPEISKQEFRVSTNTATDRDRMMTERVAKAVAEQTDTPKMKKATDQQVAEDANTIQRSIPREATQTRHQVVQVGEI